MSRFSDGVVPKRLPNPGRLLANRLISTDDAVMELRQLLYLDAVVRCGGFTRAARQLHVAQPAISAQIRQLEKELGVELLTRTTRQVAITQAGELFLSRARRALNELDAARGDLSELTHVLRGRVSLGATEVLGDFDLPAALASYTETYPGVEIRFRSEMMTNLLEALDVGDLDFILGPIQADLPARYSIRPLVSEEWIVLTPPGHPLADRRRIQLRDLSDDSFVCMPVGSGLRSMLDALATVAGFSPRVQFETSSPSSMRALVSAGLGVAILAASATRNPGSPINVHEIEPHVRHPPYGIIQRRERQLTSAARTLRAHLVTAVARTVPPPVDVVQPPDGVPGLNSAALELETVDTGSSGAAP